MTTELWKCVFCGSMNYGLSAVCSCCGARFPREERREEKSVMEVEGWGCQFCGRVNLGKPGNEVECYHCRAINHFTAWEEEKSVSTGYSGLANVLTEALMQASNGKGKERHADDQAYEDQPIMWIEQHFQSYQLGQAVKKIHESQRLDVGPAVGELLGAINYLAARVIHLRSKN